ncbi:RNA-directed DNA polymerase, eukaryota, reverse transcriptase zinc-binding domain protein [Tanacetum coccineum]
MSTIRQNDKRQIRVPSKLIDFDYGIEADLQEKSYEVEEDSGNRGAKVVETVIDKDEDELVSLDSGSKSSVSENMDKPVISSYAKILNQKLDNKLTRIPTVISDNGVEVVIFDDEIIKEGGKKWDLTVCGYFNVTMEVYGKHMFVQKWDLSVCLERTEPNKLLLWVKFKNLPLEAWSTKGNSAIPSRLGNPLIMDQVTTQMCNSGNGRTGYARVIIEVEADRGVPDQVEYDWKPPLYSFCSVFGHTDEKCRYRPRTVEEIKENDKATRDVEEAKKKDKEEEFVQVNRKKQMATKQAATKQAGRSNGTKKTNVMYQPVSKKDAKEVDKGNNSDEQVAVKVNNEKNKSPVMRNKWNVNKSVVDKDVNEAQNEDDDVFVELNGSASKVARNEISSSYASVLNNSGGKSVLKALKSKELVIKFLVDRYGLIMLSGAVEVAELWLVGIGISTKERILCSFIHAETEGRLRKKLWIDLNNYKSICNNNPWIIMGDMNVSLNLKDHSEGMSYRSQDIEDFQDCVNNLKIDDVASTGLHFTWTKSLLNPNYSILKKINRVIGNEEFFDIHKRAHVVFLPYGISDHSPVVLTYSKNMKAQTKAFRLVKKLNAMKPVMNNLNWKNGNLNEKVKKLKKTLDDIQTSIEKDPYNDSLRKIGVDTLGEYSVALEDEEKLMFQRAKGTDNIRYVDDEVPIQLLKHFESFLSPQPNMECLDLDSKIFKNKIDLDVAGEMIRKVSKDEIKEAMFSIDDNKAPGPDGFTAKFFKKAWFCIGEDVCNAVEEFFLNGKLLGELNDTLITLVPKVSTPNRVTDFRPIACCNVVYKCISKILTNRIKNVFDTIVDKNQSAFIPGRLITDNILLTQELLKGYNCTKGPKRCSMKIDIQKAYDTVKWSFFEKALRMFGFHSKMIGWIMICVSTPSYSICINGERHGYFKGGRGLRQGDPLSPYLFTIVIEVFNLILKQRISEEKNFKYHLGCKKLLITHLCFADDLLVLCHGDTTSVKVIKQALEDFSKISGLYPNLGKSTIFCGSMDDVTIARILNIIPFKRGKLPVRYIGVPLVAKQLGVNDCKSLVDKVKSRVHD